VKHLPKHLQPRWRYLAVGIEAWPDATLGRNDLQRALWYGAQNLLGDTGSARLDLSVLRFRFRDGDGEALVRVRRGTGDSARAVIACLDEIAGHPFGVRVRGVSGTVRSCEEKYMRRRRQDLKQRHVVFGDAERSASIRDGRVDVRTDEGFAGATTLDLK
jgi:ribonuclease P/MRP protein subunit POP5